MEPLNTHSAAEPVIRLEHLRKSFGDKTVLADVNMSLHRGENLVVLGRSGQGKSVTVKCIIGLINQDEGKCEVLGREVSTLSETDLKNLREKVGFVFQGSALYDSMTVADNLAFPLIRVLGISDTDEIDSRVDEMLDSVGLLEAKNKMPAELSGGMRKRVGLARTLILKPEIMLYDEPTTGLDPITSREISDLILEMQEKFKVSSIVITHDMACARITGSRLVVLNDGKLIAEGSFDELVHSDNQFVRSFFK